MDRRSSQPKLCPNHDLQAALQGCHRVSRANLWRRVPLTGTIPSPVLSSQEEGACRGRGGEAGPERRPGRPLPGDSSAKRQEGSSSHLHPDPRKWLRCGAIESAGLRGTRGASLPGSVGLPMLASEAGSGHQSTRRAPRLLCQLGQELGRAWPWACPRGPVASRVEGKPLLRWDQGGPRGESPLHLPPGCTPMGGDRPAWRLAH